MDYITHTVEDERDAHATITNQTDWDTDHPLRAYALAIEAAFDGIHMIRRCAAQRIVGNTTSHLGYMDTAIDLLSAAVEILHSQRSEEHGDAPCAVSHGRSAYVAAWYAAHPWPRGPHPDSVEFSRIMREWPAKR